MNVICAGVFPRDERRYARNMEIAIARAAALVKVWLMILFFDDTGLVTS